jgi:hypothetical protein
MNSLPEDIIYEIGRFLSRKDFRSLLTTSTKINHSRHQYQYLDLNKENSKLFASNEERGELFRHKVLLQIQKSNKQLSIDLSMYQGITDVSMLGNLDTLDLYYCRKIKDISMLGNVKNLNLSFCYRITDVSMLGNVHNLDLTSCSGITDVSMLGNVNTLKLTSCSGIIDVPI